MELYGWILISLGILLVNNLFKKEVNNCYRKLMIIFLDGVDIY